MRTKRKEIEYSENELLDIEDDKEIIIRQISKKIRNKSSEIFDNQEKCSNIIVNELRNREIINIMCVALTQ